MNKKILCVFMAVIAGSMMSGCSGAGKVEAVNNSGTTSQEKAGAKFGFITGTGGLGDKNMNDATYEGLKSWKRRALRLTWWNRMMRRIFLTFNPCLLSVENLTLCFVSALNRRIH